MAYRRPFSRPFSPIFTGCKASGLAAFSHNSALSRKGQRQAQALALCASLGLLPPFSATGGGGIRPRRARKRQECTLFGLTFCKQQREQRFLYPPSNFRYCGSRDEPPMTASGISSAVRSSETSNLPCGELRRLSLQIKSQAPEARKFLGW